MAIDVYILLFFHFFLRTEVCRDVEGKLICEQIRFGNNFEIKQMRYLLQEIVW